MFGSMIKFQLDLAFSVRAASLLRKCGSAYCTYGPAARTLSTSANLKPKKARKEGHRNVYSKGEVSKSFAMNMFRGQIQLEQMFPFPQPLDSEGVETVGLLIEPTEKFFKEVNDPVKNDSMEKIDPRVIDCLGELGAFGMQVPSQFDGIGLTNTQYTRLAEVVGANDLAVATMLGAHQSIGFKGILLYGTQEQKQKYLPDLARGRKLAAFCLTEPSSGSDASSIRSRAELSSDGMHYILNGNKIWISNGGIADVFTVFAKTPTKMPDGSTKDRISAFIVERGFGGVTSGPPESKMGIKASNTTEVVFDNVRVPIENLIGMEGEGFKVAMNILNNGRFGIAAIMNGTMKFCIQKAIEHANTRTQFGRRLIEFGSIRDKIVKMASRQYATESMAYMISGNMDRGSVEFQLEAAMSKIYGSEAAWYVCDEAIQILGGMGYMKECGLERVLRDLRIVRIYEGTNDILRLFVALLGLEHAGNHLRDLQHALKRPLASYGLIKDEFVRRAKRIVKMKSSSLIEVVHPSLSEHAVNLTNLIEYFGIIVENLLLKYGKSIIEQQVLLTPLADAAINIYTMAVVLSRTSHSLNSQYQSAMYEKKLCDLLCRTVGFQASSTLTTLRSLRPAEEFPLTNELAEMISENSGVLQKSPLNI